MALSRFCWIPTLGVIFAAIFAMILGYISNSIVNANTTNTDAIERGIRIRVNGTFGF